MVLVSPALPLIAIVHIAHHNHKQHKSELQSTFSLHVFAFRCLINQWIKNKVVLSRRQILMSHSFILEMLLLPLWKNLLSKESKV